MARTNLLHNLILRKIYSGIDAKNGKFISLDCEIKKSTKVRLKCVKENFISSRLSIQRLKTLIMDYILHNFLDFHAIQDRCVV